MATTIGQVREFALSLPETAEEPHHDYPRWNEHMEAVGLSKRQRTLIDFKPTLPPISD